MRASWPSSRARALDDADPEASSPDQERCATKPVSSSLLRLIGLATTTHPKHQPRALERRAWRDRAMTAR